MTRTTRWSIAATIGSMSILGSPGSASAHPLGDFTVNTAAQVVIGADEIGVYYAIDMAEIPTLQSNADDDGDARIDRSEATKVAERECADAASAMQVSVGADRLTLSRVSAVGQAAVGSADLETLRVDCEFRAEADLGDLGPSGVVFAIRDGYGAGDLGWHEVTVVGDRMTIQNSTVPTASSSDRLSSYPEVADIVDVTWASALVTPGGDRFVAGSAYGSEGSAIPGVDGLADRLIGSGEVSFGSGTLLVLTATLLGAMHAFAPGHGKTVMAAYLLGERGGSVRQALILGSTVTVTHTIGVLVLGAMISLSTLTAPDRIYPWLGIVSGLLVAGIGANLLRLAVRTRRTGGLLHLGHHHGDPGGRHHLHDHDHDHDHDHVHDHDHDHHDGHVNDGAHGRLRLGSVVAMGFAGGLVPSPSALVVLLGAVALGRTTFGIAMVAAYGLGMAITLISAGLLFVLLRERAAGLLNADPGSSLRVMLRYAPLLTATAVVGGGVLIAARAAALL